MTEGNGHVIDPAGVARLALQAAVAEHGPLVLPDPGIMDRAAGNPGRGCPGRPSSSVARPGGLELLDWQKEFNTEVNKIRWMIEQVISHFENWTVMHNRLPPPAQHVRDNLSQR